MVATVGVITPTLNADMLVAALITKAATERTVEPGAPPSACIGERHDLLPLLLGDARVTIGTSCELSAS